MPREQHDLDECWCCGGLHDSFKSLCPACDDAGCKHFGGECQSDHKPVMPDGGRAKDSTRTTHEDESLMPATDWREFNVRSFALTVLIGFVGFLVVVYGVSRMMGIAPPKPAPGWTYVAIGGLLFSEAIRNNE